MAKTEPKLAFKFIGEKIETIQTDYQNLIEDTSFLFLKYQLYIKNIHKGYFAPEVREQNLNTLQLEEINELQIGLKDFKVKTLALMDSTSMLLHRKYPKQPKVNLTSAEQVKELLNQELVFRKTIHKNKTRDLSNITTKYSKK